LPLRIQTLLNQGISPAFRLDRVGSISRHEGCFRLIAQPAEKPPQMGSSAIRWRASIDVQECAMLPVRTVLHPTDFSDYSSHAFRLACSLARDYGARLLVLHVAPPPVIVYSEGLAIPPEPAKYKDQLWQQLRQVQAGDPKVRVEHRLVEGDAVAEILRTAGETKCDLIVMGTHGRTGLGRLLMGSVAEQVVRKAPCPVVTVKTPFPETRPVHEPVTESGRQAAGVPSAARCRERSDEPDGINTV
jgi:nucleotide-binding universal stress UspA family protein